ncbi:mitogen-activated protein kinase kinase kinase 18-like [Impatiens glandulifera]|uniref:mitogen-activated protein kinase kinase kinase 18-like n=1 Tax=Impatiens glandulifera TaxID=253017 RepID=UPI001FB137D9|nr:mitogen-activated protein kinase kinase kinase 18-like [Impatiens glandulifera]
MEEWTRGRTIGRGSTAQVSIATSKSGQLFAVKSTHLDFSDQLKKEAQILSRLSSPYVINYMGCQDSEENGNPMFNLFMEYVPSGTISDEIRREKGSLDESKMRSYLRDLLMGIDYLHSNGIAHRDIKSQNVLVGKFGAKICDFGCAGDYYSQSTFSGTPVFMAPEVARGEEQWFPADIWAVGCLIIEMATGSNPWPEITNPVSALYRIGFSGDLPEFPRRLSNDGKDFLSKCLVRDCRERWTAKQLLEHPFVKIKVSIPNSGEVEVFERESPCSVLDQSYWDSLPESSDRGSSVSPARRILRLMSSNVCNWSVDESWVSVRTNCIDINEGEEIERDEMLGEDDRFLAGAGDLVSENLKKKWVEYKMLNNKEDLECDFMLFEELCVVVVKLKSMQVLFEFIIAFFLFFNHFQLYNIFTLICPLLIIIIFLLEMGLMIA